MSSNLRNNMAEINRFREELKAELGEIADIDAKILNTAVNTGKVVAINETPVDTGFLKGSWSAGPLKTGAFGVEKTLLNTADYASYVNDGHRTVNQKGETIDFVNGYHMLDKAVNVVNVKLKDEFRKEVNRINGKYNK